MYIDGDTIVVSIRAHQYKTAVTHDDDTIAVSGYKGVYYLRKGNILRNVRV